MSEGPKGRRLLLEGAVIVGSILLAFTIDAGWDYVQERSEEREILAALHAEFRENVRQGQAVVATYTEGRELLEAFFAMSDDEIRQLEREVRGRTVLMGCFPASFDAVLGTTDALIGAGKLDLLRDQHLREALTSYLNLVTDAVQEMEYINSAAGAVWSREIALGGPWSVNESERGIYDLQIAVPPWVPEPSGDDLLRLRSDRDWRGYVARCQLDAGYYLSDIGLVQDQARKILDLIESRMPELASSGPAD